MRPGRVPSTPLPLYGRCIETVHWAVWIAPRSEAAPRRRRGAPALGPHVNVAAPVAPALGPPDASIPGLSGRFYSKFDKMAAA